MSNKLILVAIGGIAVGAICLGTAVGIGGHSVLSHLGDIDFGNWDEPRCGVALAGHDDTREIAWNDSDEVQLEIPADVHYKRGEGDKLVITGDAALLPLVRLDHKGRIRFTCRVRHSDNLTVTLPGRDFKSYSVKGSGDITLEYNLAGAGDAKLGGLDVGRAELNIAGHGDTEVNVRDSLEVNIAGHGDVRLVTEPRHLETNIFGAGEIVHPNGDVSSTHGAGSRRHDSDAPMPPAPPAPPAKKI